MNLTTWYKDTFAVHRPDNTVDDGGAVTNNYAITSGQIGFFHSLSKSETVELSKMKINASYRLYCTNTVDIINKDRIVFDGKNYEVKDFVKFDSNKVVEKHQEILLEFESAV